MTVNDRLRQTANLILAPLIWITSSLGFFVPDARSPGEFSDMSDNLLVPASFAFSIWFPIFVGCIAYGVYQAFPRNREIGLFRRTGWWTALGFTLICVWSLITAFAPTSMVQWGTALVFVPALLAFAVATVRLSRHHGLTKGRRWLVLAPISLITGWCSLAVFLNWTPIAYDTFADGNANIVSSLLILSASLGTVVLIHELARGNRIYLIPPIWGLAFLALRHSGDGSGFTTIGWAALIGIALLLVVGFRPRARRT